MSAIPDTAVPRQRPAADPVPAGLDDAAGALRPPEPRRGALRSAAARFGPALGLYGAVKLIGFAVFMMLLESSGKYRGQSPRFGGGAHPWDVVGSWDGWWYRQIAERGYDPKLVPDPGSYVSESNYFEKDWQRAFWGNNYARLRRIKKQYDRDGLFFVHHGVGSEDWSADGMARLRS